MRKSLWTRIAVAGLVLGLLAGCSGSGKPTTPAETPKETTPAPAPGKPAKTAAVAATAGDAIVLDPHDTNDNLSYGIENTMYEGLVGFDKDMKVTPVLAESYRAIDAKTFEFRLRKGVKFHTGEDLNAAAVKKSFLRVANPENKLRRLSLFSNIASVDTPDEYTVVFHLKEEFGAMLYNFAHPAGKVIAPSGIDKGKDELARNPKYGTGPFIFKEWVTNDHITVTKNPNYWNKDGAAKVESITFRAIAESATRVNGLKAGDIDFVLPVPSVDAQVLKNDPNVKIVSAPSIYAFYMAMNVTKKPFDDKRVREALNLAIDRQAIRQGVLRGFAEPMTSVLAAQVKFYVKQGDEIKRDVAKAKQLLQEAGYKGEEVEIWHANSTERKDLAAAIVQQLSEVGFKAKSVPMDNAALSANLWTQDRNNNKVQLYLGGWSTSTGDADWAIRPLLYGKSAPPASYNVGFYDNAAVNKLIEDGLKTADESVRAKVYADLQKEIWNDFPWVFLYVPHNVSGMGANVDGVFVQGDGIVNYNGIYFLK
ncbi:MAG TPA: glutathione ABC transporter substrate-binding protein [Symbiobacteriaceae bacterium]|nr:glutathione ABC transporter substrate-binding protein [Symbiobacteriaceae bacterium]